MKKHTRVNYKAKQGILPLFFSDFLNINDPVLVFDKFMEGIDCSKYLKNIPVHETGRIRYNPVDMLKTVLFGFMTSGYMSLRELYIPQSGRISIDGMDVSLMDPQMLRKQIGVVLQENFMFNGTVAENISIHCPDVTIDKIMETAKIAGAHDFIMELEEGYDTIIGEKGVSLSGGQKQRIAIARAIINDPRILIFDEATSALDYESESIIQKNLKDICKNRTVLIIAHRLSTLSTADEIMVIDRGELKESGSHDELMKKDGLYAYLYNQQLRGEVE